MKRFYYTYKITLLKGDLAGCYYFGKHSTDDLNDGYAGSGKIIKNYYTKYGKIEHQTYIKEIISFYSDDEQLNIGEIELVGNLYKDDENCLNLVPGGGYNDIVAEKISKANKGRECSDETRKKISERTKQGMNNPETRKKCSENAKKTRNRKGKPHSEETKKRIGEIKKGNKNRLGIGFSDESKAQISASLKEFYKTHKRQYNEDGSYKYIDIETNE